MIVTTRDDVVRLSGALVKNQWFTIKAAANVLLQSHPQGIIINCAEMTHVSEEGAKTFLEAIKDIQAAGARIIVSNLPQEVMDVLRSVPGVRSQLPVAATEEEARRSLLLSGAAPGAGVERQVVEGGIVVPILPGLDIDYALVTAGRLARETRAAVHVVYLLEIARHLPLSAPLLEEEASARATLDQTAQQARKQHLQVATHLERVRDPNEGLLQLLKSYHAGYVVLGVAIDHSAEEFSLHEMANTVMHRATCGVLITRKPMPNGDGNSRANGH